MGVHAEEAGDIAADGGAGIGDGTLGAGRASEAERERAGHAGAVAEVAWQGVAPGSQVGAELAHAVGEVGAKHPALIPAAEHDAGDGHDEERPIGPGGIEVAGDTLADPAYHPLEGGGRGAGGDARKHGKHKYKRLPVGASVPPVAEASERGGGGIHRCFTAMSIGWRVSALRSVSRLRW